MANKPATRPSTTRKVTRSTEDARKKALNDGVAITLDGKTYTVRVGDLSAQDTRALRREFGMSFVALQEAFEKDPDLDLVAAVVWLARRNSGERDLTFDEVAEGMGYDIDIDVKNASEVEDDEDPEVHAGSS